MVIDDLEQLANAATPGPYRACGCGKCGLVWAPEGDVLLADGSIRDDGHHMYGENITPTVSPEQGSANAAFIAAANPDTVKRLIGCIRVADQSLRSWAVQNKNYAAVHAYDTARAALEQE